MTDKIKPNKTNAMNKIKPGCSDVLFVAMLARWLLCVFMVLSWLSSIPLNPMYAIKIATTITSAMDHLPDLKAKKRIIFESLHFWEPNRYTFVESILATGKTILNIIINSPTKTESALWVFINMFTTSMMLLL